MHVLGVILCGGQSSRMGSDKGLLPYAEGITWAEHQYTLLESVCPRVIVSVNPVQKNNYRACFSEEQLVSDQAALQLKGPLLGLISVHLEHPTKDIFLLACDMIRMKEEVLQVLLQRYLQNRNKDAWVFINEEGFEPLCAIYKAATLAGIVQQYRAGQINRFSMKSVLEKIHAEPIPVAPDWKTCFANFNDHEELNRL